MDEMINLSLLLKHDVVLLCSAEDQIIEALPAMIAATSDFSLQQALDQHFNVTKEQRERLDRLRDILHADDNDVTDYSTVFSNLTGASTKSLGMAGLIAEAQKLISEKLAPAVMDAAIILACQKIEHYEIASYGTACSYSRLLDLNEVYDLLQQTLKEEYEADRLLTALAARINQAAKANIAF